jgi:hypothetical protein
VVKIRAGGQEKPEREEVLEPIEEPTPERRKEPVRETIPEREPERIPAGQTYDEWLRGKVGRGLLR